MNEHARRRQRSSPAYPGIAAHYRSSQPHHGQQQQQQFCEPKQQHHFFRENSAQQQNHQFNRMPFNEAPEHSVRKSSSYSPTFADSVLIKHPADFSFSSEMDDDSAAAAENQNRLRANLIVLHNSIIRDYHMHNLAQVYFGTTHLLLFYVPSSILTLGGGILSLMYFAYDEDEDTQDLRDLLVTLFIFAAALLQGLSNYFSTTSRSIKHRHTAGELRKLSNRLQNHYFSADLTTLRVADEWSEGKKLTMHEMVKFQQLYDQIIRSCHSDLPRSFVATFSFMDVRIEALLGSMYDVNIEARGWLMPLVYQGLASAIREAILWPLVTWNSPQWYAERALDSLIKPSSLLNELDDSEEKKMKKPHRRILFCFKKREQGDKLRHLVRGNAARESMVASREQNISDESIERRFDDEYDGMEEKMEEGEIIRHNPEGMQMVALYPSSNNDNSSLDTPNYGGRGYDPSLMSSHPTPEHDQSAGYEANPPIYFTRSMGKSDSNVNEREFIFDDDTNSSVRHDIQNLANRESDGDTNAVSRTMTETTREREVIEEKEKDTSAVGLKHPEMAKVMKVDDTNDLKENALTENLSYSSSSPSVDLNTAPVMPTSNIASALARIKDLPIGDDDEEDSSVSQAAKDDVARIAAEAEAEAAEEATQKYSQSSKSCREEEDSVGSERLSHLTAASHLATNTSDPSDDKVEEAARLDTEEKVRIADKDGAVRYGNEVATKDAAKKEAARNMADIEAERRATEEESARLIAEAIAMKAAKDAAEKEAVRKKAEEEAVKRAAEEEAERLRAEAAEKEAVRLKEEEEAAKVISSRSEEDAANVWSDEGTDSLMSEQKAASLWPEEDMDSLRSVEEATRTVAEMEAARLILKAEEEAARMRAVAAAMEAEEIEAARLEAEKKADEREAEKEIVKLMAEEKAENRAAEEKIAKMEAEEIASGNAAEEEIAKMKNEQEAQKMAPTTPSDKKTSFAKGTKIGDNVSKVRLLVKQLENNPKRSSNVLGRNNDNNHSPAVGLSQENSMSGVAAGMLLKAMSGEGASHSTFGSRSLSRNDDIMPS